MISKKDKWDLQIGAGSGLLSIDYKSIWRYRDLLVMFVKRDIVTIYKQTVLGPIWFLLQPIFTMLVFVIVFGKIAEISTDNLPQPLFYLAGIVIWNYFAECFTQTSDTFSSNQDMFGKVYFPRLILPFSKIVSSLIKFLIQFSLFVALYIYFVIKGFEVSFSENLLLFPLILLMMSMMGLGLGLLFTSMTTKYRDLKFLLQFGIQLLMYGSCIIHPFSEVPDKYKSFMYYNPITQIIEAFRHIFLGKGLLEFYGLCYAFGFSLLVFLFGVIVFNKTERNFMDTV